MPICESNLRIIPIATAGCPPAPIGNPGKAALIATLNPEKTEYLYFVARGDGTHIFSRTNAEHEAAKRRIKRLEKSRQLN